MLHFIGMEMVGYTKNPKLLISEAKQLRFYIFLFIFFINYLPIKSQTIDIKGKVYDNQSKEALPYASIKIFNTTKGTITNTNGEFKLLCNKNDKIIISFIGYKKKTIIINKNILNIGLTPLQETLQAVEINDYSPYFLSKTILNSKKNILKRNKIINSKTYVKIISKNNDNIKELYEGFYTSKLKKNGIYDMTYKNARIYLFNNKQSIRSLDFCSYITKNTYVFYKPTYNIYKNNLSNNINYRQNNVNEVKYIFESPFLYNKDNNIIKNFTLSGNKVNDTIFKVFFKAKKISTNGEILIINNNIKIIKINKIFNKNNIPLSIDNNNLKIINLNISLNIFYDNNYPLLYIYNFNYSFVNTDNNDTNMITTQMIIYNYEMYNEFIKPKYNFKIKNLNDYDLLAITPYNNKIWEKEKYILDTDKEKDFKNKNDTYFINNELKVIKWKKNINIDTSLVTKIKSPYLIFNIETSIIYDCYKNDSIYIKTDALLDYNNTFFSFNPDKRIIYEVFKLTKKYANILQNELNKTNNIKNYDYIYSNVYKRFITEKTHILKEYIKYISPNAN